MPRYLRKEFEGAKYHITVRGNGRRRIFIWDQDRKRFLRQLEESLEQYGVILYAYALMSNHYHLLIETPRANVSRFMQRLNTAYGMYFRNKHQSPGHVFQGRFGAKLVAGDDYLLGLTRYIHLNPVKTRHIQKRPKEEQIESLNCYTWSSYPGYVNTKREEDFVDYRWRELLGGGPRAQRNRYRKWVESKLLEKDKELLKAMKVSTYAIGDEDFVGWVEDQVRRGRQAENETDADVNWPEERCVPVEEIREAVADVYDCAVGDLDTHGHRAGEGKCVAIGLSCRLSGLTNRDIGKAFGMTGAAIGQQNKRFLHLMKESDKARLCVERVLKALGCPLYIL
jgi:REP element-mobilizing transposase RayT